MMLTQGVSQTRPDASRSRTSGLGLCSSASNSRKLTFTGEGLQSKIGSDNDHVRIGMSPKVASDNPSRHGV
jgi:hypothetical protein